MNLERINEFIEERKDILSDESFYWWTTGFTHALSMCDEITANEKRELRIKYLGEDI